MIRRTLFAAAVTALVALAVGAGSATAGSSADPDYARDASSATAAAAAGGQRRAVRRRAVQRRKAARRCAAGRRQGSAAKNAGRCRRPARSPGARGPDGAPAPAPPSSGPPGSVDPLAGPPLPPAPVLGSYLSVRATEYSYALSRPVVATGRVTFELRNGGEDPHNLVVSPEGSHQVLASFADLGPGLVAAQGVDLAQGRYYLWCSLDAHEAMGMKATLRVE